MLYSCYNDVELPLNWKRSTQKLTLFTTICHIIVCVHRKCLADTKYLFVYCWFWSIFFFSDPSLDVPHTCPLLISFHFRQRLTMKRRSNSLSIQAMVFFLNLLSDQLLYIECSNTKMAHARTFLSRWRLLFTKQLLCKCVRHLSHLLNSSG